MSGIIHSQIDPTVQVSVDFLKTLKNGEDASSYVEQFADMTHEELKVKLDTDAKKLAFWVNVYNGFIQHILLQKPELYEDRGAFFSEPMIEIAGRTWSFGEIEHGLIRHSQFELFLGYLTNPFAPDYEKDLRVEEKDPRIHFALNCGAKSCPPVAIYRDEVLDEQFDFMTEKYLNETTNYIKEEDHAEVVALFSWFRGDFGGGDGIRDMLVRYDAVPQRPDKVTTTSYDWTLKLDNWRSINL